MGKGGISGHHVQEMKQETQAAQTEGVFSAECPAAGCQCWNGGGVHPGSVAGRMADTGFVSEPYGGAERGSFEPFGQQSEQ